MAVSRIDGPNPNRSLVYLRAGQSVGRTQDCYMSKKTIEMRVLEEFCHFQLMNSMFFICILLLLVYERCILWDGTDYHLYPPKFQTEVIPILTTSFLYHFL